MRSRAVLAAALPLSLVLAGCASAAHNVGVEATASHPPVSARPSPSAPVGGQAFAPRARQIAAQWPGSAQQRLWRTGYLPTQDPTVLPTGAFHSSADKEAFAQAAYTIQVPLPTTGPTGSVRWATGGALSLPELTPMQALRLAGGGGAANPQSTGKLVVVSGAPTTLQVHTNRGLATVPAWTFRLAGYRDALTVAAVRPSGSTAVNPLPGLSPASVDGSPGLNAVSGDGRTLTVTVAHGTCGVVKGAEPVIDVYETGAVVVLGSRPLPQATPAPTDACDLAMRMERVTVQLARPLGDRTVLGVADGSPVALPADPGDLVPVR